MSQIKRVLLIMTDQQRADTIHALGCEPIVTPNLDALAADSTVFENCYTPSPVCAPARHSLLSGMYPARHGSSNNSTDLAYDGDGMYGLMTEAGVDTCAIGKMHFIRDRYALHGLARRITQEELPDLRDDYTRFLLGTEYQHVIDYNGMRSEMYYIPQLSQLPAKYHPTQWIGDRTVEYLSGLDKDRPSFTIASFIHPHPPFAPPVPWNKLHRMEMCHPFVPENSADLISYHNYFQNAYKGLSAGTDLHLLTQMKNFYYSCISFVDYQIGRIVAELKRRGMYDDTLLIFTSDHGELLGDYGCLGKRCMLDPVAKVPLLVRMPGVPAGRRQEVCSLVDLEPTVLKALGLPCPADCDGQDLFGGREREFVYSQYANGTTGLYMIASARDKLIWSAADKRYWYFDRFPEQEDRYEENAPRCARMRELLQAYIASDRAPNKDDRVIDVGAYLENEYRYRLVKQDSVNRSDDERALLPEGYHIDLDIEYTWKRKKEDATPV